MGLTRPVHDKSSPDASEAGLCARRPELLPGRRPRRPRRLCQRLPLRSCRLGPGLARRGADGERSRRHPSARPDRRHDRPHVEKRALVLASVVLLVTAALAIALRPTTPVVFLADVTMAILGAVFAPAVAAITVG